ncbi:MAG: TonB-dependent receptor [Pseudomonadota bacterium]
MTRQTLAAAATLASIGAVVSPSISAQQAAMGELEEVIVSASRRVQPINEVARTVMVINQDILAEEMGKSSNIANLLGARVPGFGAPTFIDQLRTQTLRGREPLYLIDGIPLAFNGGAAFAQGPLVKFDSGTVERVEVLYGPTAIYGAGGVGGVIQFFTAEAPSDREFELNFRQSFTTYTGADDPLDSDALSWRSAIRVGGTIDRFDYLLSYSYDAQNGVYDGNGDIANPVYYGYTDDDSYFVKLGFEPGLNQRLEILYSYVDRDYDSPGYGVEVTEDGFAIADESEDIPSFRYRGSSRVNDEKSFFSFSYLHSELWGGEFRFQAYTREDDIREPLVDFRIPPGGPFPDNYQAVKSDQSDGVRLQYFRPITEAFNVIVGADYEEQDRDAVAYVYDIGTPADRDFVVTEPVNEGQFVYPFKLETLGLFVQAEWEVSDRLRLSGGVRYEDAEFEIGDGTLLFEIPPPPVFRQGGSGEDDGYAYNIGLTYNLNDNLMLYGNYAEGYELPSLSSVSRIIPPGAPLESDEAIEPQIVDNYELGLRGAAGNFSYSAAIYYSESDFGQNFIYDPVSLLGRYNRSPERNYGGELVGGWQPNDALTLTASFSMTEAEFDPEDTGDFVAQSGLEVQPWKATLNGSYVFTENFDVNFQLLVVGDRDRALDDGVDLWEVKGYEIIDVGLNYRFDLAGARTLTSLQITNLLDEDYLAPSSQSYTNNLAFSERVAGAPGRAITLAFDFTW